MVCAKSHGHAPMRLRTEERHRSRPSGEESKQSAKRHQKPQEKRKTSIKTAQPETQDHSRQTFPAPPLWRTTSANPRSPSRFDWTKTTSATLPPRLLSDGPRPLAPLPASPRFRFPVTSAPPPARPSSCMGTVRRSAAAECRPAPRSPGGKWIRERTRGSHRTTSSAKPGLVAGGPRFSHGAGSPVRLCATGRRRGVFRFVSILALSRLTSGRPVRSGGSGAW